MNLNFWKHLNSNQKLLVDIAVPLIYLIPLVVAFFSEKNFGFGHRWLVYAGLGIGGTGVILWIAAMFFLGNSLAVLPGSDKLVTRGLYKYIRHPVYLGIELNLFGLFLACGSVFGMCYLLVLVIPLNVARSRLEEETLIHQFGEHYEDYKKSTWF